MIDVLDKDFKCSETMRIYLDRLITYAKMSGVDPEIILSDMRKEGLLPCADKRSSKDAIDILHDRIFLSEIKNKNTGVAVNNNRITRVFVEVDIKDHPRTKKILNNLPDIPVKQVNSFMDVADEDEKRTIILAKRRDHYVLDGAPVCQDFDEKYFYYSTTCTGCIYDCSYCYLKGMYPNRHIIVYVNLEDTFAEIKSILNEHPAYVCISYDTDLLALEGIVGAVEEWNGFVINNPGLTCEVRTKCANADHIKKLTPCDRMIYAFTLSPDEVIRMEERYTQALDKRIECINDLIDSGYTVRLCLDPMIAFPGWERVYGRFLDDVTGKIDLNKVRDISVGTFRISSDYIKKLRNAEPDSAVVWYPFINENGYLKYKNSLRKKMISMVTERLERSNVTKIAVDE